jgi:hypothetical protein
MSFFRRKDQNQIPPVQPEQKGPSSLSPAPSYRSTATTYNASRDGDLYGNDKSSYNQQPSSGGYGGGGGYDPSRGGAPDPNRSELFSGYNPERAGQNRFTASDRRPELREPAPGEEGEEDVEGIKQQTRATKQESLNSSRNALQLAREAEKTARGTLLKLSDQSEKLANTERHLDISKNHALRAEDNTDELKKLNKSIFNPSAVFVLDKQGKRAAKEAKIQARYDEDREERERGLSEVRETQDRIGQATTYGTGGGRQLSGAQQAVRKEQRSRFQFEATNSDDEIENELDDNLGEISDMTKRLKALGTSMGQELDNQNQRIDRIGGKAGELDNRMFKNTEKLKRIK